MNRQYSALSGIAILLVVLNHAIHFGLQLSPVEGTWLRVLIVLQALGTFAVPAFLFISGAFVSYAAKTLSLKFTKSSLERIFWPYLLWSSVFYLLEFLLLERNVSLLQWAKSVLVGYPYHFVPLLICCYLIAPLLVVLGKRTGWILIAIALYQLLLIYLRFPSVFGFVGNGPGWLAVLKPPVLFKSMADWAIYFPMGLVFSLHGARLRPLLLRFKHLAIAITIILFSLGILNAFQICSLPWARFAAPLPLMWVLPIIDRKAIPWLNWLELLGRRSYSVYLIHFIVINLIVFLTHRFVPGLQSFPVIVFPGLLVAAVALSLLLTESIGRIASAQKFSRYVLG